MIAKVRITVLKKLDHKEFTGAWTQPEGLMPACGILKEGQEFTVDEDLNKPESFCSWAWVDIQKYILGLARGANYIGVKPGHFVTCCTDGFRPVVFKLERMEESAS